MSDAQKNIVIIGATSAMAKSLSRLHAANNDRLVLCARNTGNLGIVADDIRTHGGEVLGTIETDFQQSSGYETLFDDIQKLCENVDIWYFFHGVLPDQEACEQSIELTRESFQVNFNSVVDLLTPIANEIERNGKGTIVVVSSVAGDRGRQSNYVYGTAKGAMNIFLQGLRNRLQATSGHVVTVKPGFVKTPMTAHLKQDGFLWATADKVAEDIYRGVKKNRSVIYTPRIWQFIMLIISHIPEFIFKRLKL